MPKLIYYVAVSLDGYIAPSDGSVDWLAPFEQFGEDYGYSSFFADIDALIMGRRTYEQVLTFGPWPYSDRRTWVCSRQPRTSDRPDVTMTEATPSELMAELDRLNVHRAWMVGGGELAGAYQAAGLIDEYRLSIMPVILGKGQSLLAGQGIHESLSLVESKVYDNGIVQLIYRRAESS